jgi:hypothetical protein
MKEGETCPHFRRPDSLSFEKGIGYCDMDGDSTNSDADFKRCQKPDALKSNISKGKQVKLKRTESNGWKLSKEVIKDDID